MNAHCGRLAHIATDARLCNRCKRFAPDTRVSWRDTLASAPKTQNSTHRHLIGDVSSPDAQCKLYQRSSHHNASRQTSSCQA
jgi:hypothetical protein